MSIIYQEILFFFSGFEFLSNSEIPSKLVALECTGCKQLEMALQEMYYIMHDTTPTG